MAENGLMSLKEAAAALGIHPATLRAWADKGEIPSSQTRGGHRRFRRSDLVAWSAAKRRGDLPGAEVVIQNALGRARFDLTEGRLNEEEWYRRLDPPARQAHRAMGRRLLTLLLGFLSDESKTSEMLEAARGIGREYEQRGRAGGLTLTETVRAYLFFRKYLYQSVLDALGANAVSPQTIKAWRELQARVAQFTDEILIALVEAYRSGGHNSEKNNGTP